MPVGKKPLSAATKEFSKTKSGVVKGKRVNKRKRQQPYKRMIMALQKKQQAKSARGLARDWCVYILRCADQTLYTGITNNLERRFKKHQEGKAAKYTRTRRPVTLVYQQQRLTRSKALVREYAIKQYSRLKKEQLITK